MNATAPRLLVVSHPAVLAVNQLAYAELRRLGWDPFVVTPAMWRNEYAPEPFARQVLPALAGRVVGRRVVLRGRVQRHAYLTSLARTIAAVRPQVAFVEAEPTSVSGVQWGHALRRSGVPFGLQLAETLDRPYPLAARAFRRLSLARAAFLAARSPGAAALAQRVDSGVRAPVIPHHVPPWRAPPPVPHGRFTIGYAGRLVPAKGLDVLIDAAAGLHGAALRFVGNGPLRAELEARAATRGVTLEIDATIAHADMPTAYARFDVLALPSRTTPTWSEQFGRVLVEALWCGVPVVGTDSGEIPWVVESTGGGVIVPEGDARALREALRRLRDDPGLRRELAARGRERVRAQFSVEAVAARLDAALRTAMSV
jgi:glycosyltransferase involved in cell wall biosynthesis